MFLLCMTVIFYLYIKKMMVSVTAPPQKKTQHQYQFWYSLLKYCCTHKYCKNLRQEHKRGLKHTKMVIVGVLMLGKRRRSSLILTGVCVIMWNTVIWALTLHRPSQEGRVCFSKCVQVCFKGFPKAPHSPDKFCRFIFFSHLLKQRK